MDYTSNRQFVAPAAAAGASTAVSAGWGNTAYATLLAAVAGDAVLTGVHCCSISAVGTFEVDIATGPAASEVVIATVKIAYPANLGFDGSERVLRLPIAIDNIASGARLSVRARGSATATLTWAVTYLLKPIVGTLHTTAQRPKVVPAAADGAAVTPGTAWANGSWVQLLASAAADLVVIGVVVNHQSIDVEYDLGIGAAASEVVITTWRMTADNAVGGPGYLEFPNPLDAIPSGSRVAVRARGTGTTAQGVSLVYLEKPL